MNSIYENLFRLPTVPAFAQKNFTEHFLQADKVMLVMIALQWFIATFITSISYDTYLYGFVGGGMITLILVFAYRFFKGTQVMRALVGIGMMLFSLIYIQQHLGRIEMHFHVFIALAILSIYKDIVPVFVAAATTIVHHLIFNYLQLYEVSLFNMPVMVFNYGCGMDIVLLHAIFVIAEALVIGYIIKLQIEYGVEQNRSENQILGLNQELSFTSMHDSLTGLPNRYNLYSQLKLMVANANRYERKFAVLFLDLDHFKNINDTLGHNVGDALLKSVSHKLKSMIRENDIVARIGGDEFIIVLNDFNDSGSLEQVIVKILDAFRQEWIIKNHFLRLSTSIGVSVYPDDSKEINELMKFADIAMYKAKSEGRDQFSFFTSTLNAQVHEDVQIANDMHRALEEREFVLYYQPKIHIPSGKIIGAEALIRWNHHLKGMIYPGSFITIAENTGFILKLGTWIIDETVAMLSRMQNAGYNDVHVSCNVSTRQFQNLHLFSDIENAIQTNQIDPSQLAIEITESVMMEYLDVTLEVLKKMKGLGIHICMDDFGTGYSSLSYLRQFPINSLKIDKSFVDDISENENNDHILLNTIIAMGQTLNLNVIAEGVEEKYQMEYLKERGCGYYQGYYFSKPVPEEVFFALLEKNRSI
ncbi:putative bifunctional diguanylate cyclase/phosphodiesterase [Sulfuricurvum sp.]|uniref:putative bifunctional diguanylate cyclase/phosphodiesterase n=1 Tax=Sulfuricurvum sp. TaxID=2025608 RepID=UPI002D5C9D75|nr:EAL domain-containing protein [Sulfuricurvum sp.]HZF70348.1 EAL domain-containing protein [Sulfuricurvum sp.]